MNNFIILSPKNNMKTCERKAIYCGLQQKNNEKY